jgi:hypothetical protein
VSAPGKAGAIQPVEVPAQLRRMSSKSEQRRCVATVAKKKPHRGGAEWRKKCGIVKTHVSYFPADNVENWTHPSRSFAVVHFRTSRILETLKS